MNVPVLRPAITPSLRQNSLQPLQTLRFHLSVCSSTSMRHIHWQSVLRITALGLAGIPLTSLYEHWIGSNTAVRLPRCCRLSPNTWRRPTRTLSTNRPANLSETCMPQSHRRLLIVLPAYSQRRTSKLTMLARWNIWPTLGDLCERDCQSLVESSCLSRITAGERRYL